jgi:ABC-2 type transport system permease protein
MKKYFKIWLITSALSVQTALENRFAAVFFLTGKFIRFFLFLYFLQVLDQNIRQVSGFTYEQLVIFYLIFNLFDLIGQLFFRGIYWFRDQVISGEFDFRLIKPISPLFQVLTRQTDVLDLPLLVVTLYYLSQSDFHLNLVQIILVFILSLAALLVLTAVHVAVAALGVLTTEVDHTIMVFRDLSSMARFPLDIYADTIRSLLTFVIPIAIAFTFPAQALLGLVSPLTALGMLGVAIGFLYGGILFWRFALLRYSSASS